jgi:hypothetical protein
LAFPLDEIAVKGSVEDRRMVTSKFYKVLALSHHVSPVNPTFMDREWLVFSFLPYEESHHLCWSTGDNQLFPSLNNTIGRTRSSAPVASMLFSLLE